MIVLGYVKNEFGKTVNWNRKVISWELMRTFDEKHDIIKEVYSCYNSAYKLYDVLYLRVCDKYYYQVGQRGTKIECYLMVFASISNFKENNSNNHNNFKTNCQRCVILPSGFEIRSDARDLKLSTVHFRTRLTNQSMLLYTPDLLGETDQLFQSFADLEKLIAINLKKPHNVASV